MSVQGMPLLSGPPPTYDINEPACRKCNKEFNVLFARSRKCNHCGYSYCHSCTDYQALMPRNNAGYDPVSVCGYCIENLTITAAGKGSLRQIPLAKLKKYAKDYNINVANVLERDDLIDRIMTGRGPNGCLPPTNENYYRRFAVPNRATEHPRGFFSRAMDAMSSVNSSGPDQPTQSSTPRQPSYQPRQRTTSHPPSTFPRSDTGGQGAHRPSQRAPDPTPRQQQTTWDYSRRQQQHQQTRPQPNPHSQPRQPQYSPRQQPQSRTSNLNVPQQNNRPRSASTPRTPTSTRPTSPPVPTLDELLNMSTEQIRGLSIGALKSIMFRNHVNIGMVVEKGELVSKVVGLVEDERIEREAARRRAEEEALADADMRAAIERSEQERREREAEREAARQRAQSQSQESSERGHVPETATPPPPSASATPEPKPTPRKMTPQGQAMASNLERTGLCVICQDEEANIAIVDCGHLAMCRACSDLIMQSTRECPLCRTRIITEARLLRIFKS